MNADLLLISPDASLESRVRRALPRLPGREVTLTVLSQWHMRREAGTWLLALMDVRSLAAVPKPIGLASTPPVVPVLWLGEAPQLTLGLPARDCLPGPVIDFLDRNLPVSKLAFILQQHLTAAHLRLRHRPELPPPPAEVHAALNNTLTGILGNAELAVELARNPNRRVSAPLTQRLECIVELASTMRSLVEATEPPARSPQLASGS